MPRGVCWTSRRGVGSATRGGGDCEDPRQNRPAVVVGFYVALLILKVYLALHNSDILVNVDMVHFVGRAPYLPFRLNLQVNME